MAVPNTWTFTLQDVVNEIGASSTSLQECFDDSNPNGFAGDPDHFPNTYFDTYGYSLRAFRGYSEPVVVVSNTVTPSSYLYGAAKETKIFTVTPTQSSTTWTVTESLLWVTLLGTSGTGTGTFSARVAGNIDPTNRSGYIRVTFNSGTPSYVDVDVEQISAFEL